MLTHPQHREEIEAYLAKHPNPNLKFGWVTVPSIIDPWVPGKKDHGLAIHLHYLIWQYLVYGEALRLHQTYGFDVVHHVSWGTISAPPQLWRLPIPFVWGPVGGGQTFPRDFRDYFKDRIGSEFIRSLRIRLLPWSPTLRKAARGSQLLLSTNRETSTLMRRVGGDHVRDAHDNAVAEHMLLDRIPPRNHGGDLRLLWAGRIVPSKGLQLGIEALAQVKDVPVRLSVAGTGPQQPKLEALARELGVCDRVEFLGQVPWVEMPSVFQSADAFLFTSLRDSMGSVTLEAMAQALPIIALDHQGVALLVPEEAGIKVPVTTPTMTVATLAQAIRRLSASPETRRRMSEASWNHARTQTWEHRAAQMSNWYEECVNRRGVDDMRGQYAMWSNPGNL